MAISFVAIYNGYFNYYKPSIHGLHKDSEVVALLDIKDFVKEYRILKTDEEKIELINKLISGGLENKINEKK